MRQRKGDLVLSVERRKEIFHLLVTAQDLQMTVEESREMVSSQFGLDDDRIVHIEQEGLASEWPPL